MKLRHRHHRNVPTLNTSSLPDLIFTVLFFFMIVTHMRQNNVKVEMTVPEGEELQQFDKKYATATIFVGKGTDGEIHIQVNDDITEISRIGAVINKERKAVAEDERDAFTVILKADKDVPLGVIADIKDVLQMNNVLHINYSASLGERSK